MKKKTCKAIIEEQQKIIDRLEHVIDVYSTLSDVEFTGEAKTTIAILRYEISKAEEEIRQLTQSEEISN